VSKIIKRFEGRISLIESKLKQIECKHELLRFDGWYDGDEYGCKVCASCGKRLEWYYNRVEFLEEKLKYETKKCTNKIKRIESEITTLGKEE